MSPRFTRVRSTRNILYREKCDTDGQKMNLSKLKLVRLEVKIQ